MRLSEHGDALVSYVDSIAAFDDALQRAPDYVNALNNKGLALIKLSQLQLNQAQESDVVESLQNALGAFQQVLTIAPNDSTALERYNLLAQIFASEAD